jgi:hypothetical protein
VKKDLLFFMTANEGAFCAKKKYILYAGLFCLKKRQGVVTRENTFFFPPCPRLSDAGKSMVPSG